MEDTIFHDKFQVIFLNSFKGGKKPSFLHPERSNILLKSWEIISWMKNAFAFYFKKSLATFQPHHSPVPLRQLFRTSPPETRNELGWAANTAFPPWMARAVWLGQGRVESSVTPTHPSGHQNTHIPHPLLPHWMVLAPTWASIAPFSTFKALCIKKEIPAEHWGFLLYLHRSSTWLGLCLSAWPRSSLPSQRITELWNTTIE